MHAAAFRELNLGRSRRGETKPPKTKNGMAQPFSWKPPLIPRIRSRCAYSVPSTSSRGISSSGSKAKEVAGPEE